MAELMGDGHSGFLALCTCCYTVQFVVLLCTIQLVGLERGVCVADLMGQELKYTRVLLRGVLVVSR